MPVSGRVSAGHSHFIATPSPLTRVSLTRVYKYRLLNKISLSRIYKYNIIGRISLARTYLYKLRSKISLSRIYRYGINSRLSLSRSYRYAIIERISLSKIYKYLIIGRITVARIYQYKISARVSLPRIYRYALQARISLARIYQYKIVGRILKPSVFKYNILNRLSLARIYKYRLLNKISLARIYRYKLFARISSDTIFKYNILAAISLSRIYRYAIKSRLSFNQTYRYAIISALFRASKSSIYKYAIKQRLTIQHIYQYNILQKVGNTNAIYFDGVNDYLALGSDTLWTQTKTKFSFSIWVKIPAFGTGTYQNIVNHSWQAVGSFIMYQNITGTSIVFAIRDSIQQRASTYNMPASLANTWINVVCTVDNSLAGGDVKIYVNGNVGNVSSDLTESLTLNAPLFIGSASTTLGGKTKDFRYWLNKALTQQEINDVVNNSANAPTPDYWLKMNEGTGNPIDSISGTKTATLTNGAFWSSGDALVFDGTDDSVLIPNNAAINNLDDFTISCWIYPTQKYAASTPHIFVKAYPSNNGFILYFTANSFILNWRVINNTGTGVSATSFQIDTEGGNKWYNVLVTFKRDTGVMSLFINKVQVGTGTNLGGLTNSMGGVVDMTINGASVPIKWGGRFKDFRVYRSVLAQADIDKVYNNDPTVSVTPSYWLKTNEGKGNPVDSIGSNVATLVNGTSWSPDSPNVLLARASSYIYNILNKISKSRTYLYRILIPCLQTQTYRYNILNKISLARIYRYRILNKISLSRIYRYGILNRLSLSRIYRYGIINFVRLSLARKYRYNILNDVFKQSTYRYKILGRLSKPRTYRYAIISRTSLSRVYKYGIKQQFSKFSKYVYKILQRVTLERRYRYSILIEEPVSWSVAGKLTDFPARVDSLVIDFIAGKWAESTLPMSGTVITTRPNQNQSENVNIGSYDYDKFRTYYIRVKQQPAQIVNKVRENLMEFNQIIEMKISVRRLSRGEAFKELQKIINELIRMWITFQSQDIWGIQAISFDSITPLQNKETITMHQSNKTVWEKTLKVILHYHKVKFKRGSDF